MRHFRYSGHDYRTSQGSECVLVQMLLKVDASLSILQKSICNSER